MSTVIRPVVLTLTLSMLTPLAARAQNLTAGSGERPPLLPEAREIALARSAAPAAVSDAATVLVLRRGGYEVAVEGTNGVTCFVDRTWPQSIEPWCLDAEASRTILPIRLRFHELREQGLDRAAIERDIADGLRAGRLPIPVRPALTYMMSAEQVLYTDEGRLVGQWKPHLMIYIPYLTEEAVGLRGAASGAAGYVSDPGTPLAHLIVPVAAFEKVAGN